jgi:HD-GYP domain-containing protein (c-di-GMP phosphodiesterase class II)
MNSVKFRLLLVLLISIASLFILYLNQTIYLARIELYNTANNEILSMNVDILQLRHIEKKFFVERQNSALLQHKQYLNNFKQTLTRLINLAQQVKIKNPDLLMLMPQIEQYEQRFYFVLTENINTSFPIRMALYHELNVSADTIENTLARMKQELKPYFDNNLIQSKQTSSLIVIITTIILLFSIFFIFRTLSCSIDAFLLFFQQAKNSHSHLDGQLFGFSEFKKMADFANEMIDARLMAQKQLSHLNENLEERVEQGIAKIKKLNQEIEATQSEVVVTMGSIGEIRSKETGNHVKRVAEYSYILATLYGLSPEQASRLKEVSPMHDLGKIAIPDKILNKPGKLTSAEREIMDTHTTLGYDMLKGSNKPLFQAAAIVAHQHHEHWNGHGYPQALKAQGIHIFGRITAIVDVFDALASDRCYKKAWPDYKIINLLKKESGQHFDPHLVTLFIAHIDQFLTVRDHYKDIF